MDFKASRSSSAPGEGARTRSVEQEIVAIQAAVEDVTQNYLETLDALGTVYDVAIGFAQLFDTASIASFTLRRILESLGVESGAIFLTTGGELSFCDDAEDARGLLRIEAIEDASLDGNALFCNGNDAVRFLQPGAGCCNVLLAPIVAAQRRLGIVVVTSEPERRFTTKDLKLVSAVTSQAAIALSGAQHLEQVLVERQKLHSVIEYNGGGIVVLAPDGRTMLTNPVARKLLGVPKDRAEGFFLMEELAGWKFSRDPESLKGDGPAEVSLEIAGGPDRQERIVSIVGRRVRGTDGELASLILNLHDSTQQRRDERMRESVLSLVSRAIQGPAETMRRAFEAAGSSPDDTGIQLDELDALAECLRRYVKVLDGTWRRPGEADLTSIVTELVEKVTVAGAPRSPRVETDLDREACRVGIGSDCARLIVQSALDQAVGVGAGGELDLRVSSRRSSPGWIALAVEAWGAELHSGIRSSLLQALVGSDGALRPEEAGRGIRLALLEEAVRRCGGEIELDSGPSGGTLLTVTLPAP